MVMKDYIKPKERMTFKWKHPILLYKTIGITLGIIIGTLYLKLLILIGA